MGESKSQESRSFIRQFHLCLFLGWSTWNCGIGDSGNRFKQSHNYGWILGSWYWKHTHSNPHPSMLKNKKISQNSLFFFFFPCRCLFNGQIKVQSRSERSGVHFNLDGFFICPTFASEKKKRKNLPP
jgi:hypothetical protein